VRLDLNQNVLVRLRRVSPYAAVKRPVGAKSRVLIANQPSGGSDTAPGARSGDLRPAQFFLSCRTGG
jgi:hypothetical protein